MISAYNLNENFINSAKRFSRRTAIEVKKNDRWEKITYSALYQKVNSLAFFLSSTGVKKSDKVAIILENRPEWAVIFFAISYVGAIAVPMAPNTPHKDISLILADSEAGFIFIPEGNPKLYNFLKGLSQIKKIITAPFEASEPGPGPFKPAAIEPDDLAVLLYTSGTTQEPKGVMLTHHNLLSSEYLLKHFLMMEEGKEVDLAYMPFYFVGGQLIIMLRALLRGSTLIIFTTPDPDDMAYFALALKLNCAIWSNDKKLKEQDKVKVYNTHELSKINRHL